MGFKIRQTKQGDQEPVCTHCNGKDLRDYGRANDRQRYFCRTCKRRSYGLPPDLRPKCPACKAIVRERRLPDDRSAYTCPKCKKCFLSEYKKATQERSKVLRYRHRFTFWLDRRARLALVEYGQAKRCTDAQAVQAIFRHVLTGAVFGTVTFGRRGPFGRPSAIPIPRDPSAAAMKFPNLQSESAKKKIAGSGGHYGRGFQPTILGVQEITVNLDDEAKEGLVFTMRRLGINHADAARWLLTHVKMPDANTPAYLSLHPSPPLPTTSGRRISAQDFAGKDRDWLD